MVKTYLRYKLDSTHGLIASPVSRGICKSDGDGGALVFVAQLERVGVWSVKRGMQLLTLSPPSSDSASSRAEVTCVVAGAGRASHFVAVGYSDGMIRVFEHERSNGGNIAMQLNGHGKAVSALAFSSCGTMLASGSRDTDVIHWDLISEQGLCRLRGHRDEVTDCAFLVRPNAAGAPHERDLNRRQSLLVTSSKDTMLKVWDLITRRCLQTVIGIRSEVWGMCVVPSSSDGFPEDQRIVAAAADNQLRFWTVGSGSKGKQEGIIDKEMESSRLLNDASSSSSSASSISGINADISSDLDEHILTSMGGITRQTQERSSQVRSTEDGNHLAVQCSGKTVEVFRRRNPREVHKHVMRRLRRHREKVAKRVKGVADEDAAAALDAEALAMDVEFAGTSLSALDAQIRLMEQAEEVAAAAEAAGRPQPSRSTITANDEWELIGLAQASSKISSFDFVPSEGELSSSASLMKLTLMLSLGNNSIETHVLTQEASSSSTSSSSSSLVKKNVITTSAGTSVQLATTSRSVTLPGHRSDIRAIAVSSDGTLLLSCAAGQAKVWNAMSGSALRSLDLGVTVGLSCGFCPGNRHAVIGCKDGRLLLFDLASSDLLEAHEAHTAALWSLSMRPDGKGFCTGSADKEVKFWDFDLVAMPQVVPVQTKSSTSSATPSVNQVLSIIHARTLKVGEEVLCVKYSTARDSTKLLVAVALVDATVKIFFDDSLKFSLSLYGHKLPVMAMDVSADGTLLVTASADKNVKLWGLDFGDCHRSFFAHADTVTGVGFVANTHYFFTCSKDKTVKYWDGDRFEQILTLEAHKSEVWALAVAPSGAFLVSGGHDRSLRVWRRTEEQVFLEEEREKEFDAVVEKDLRDPDGDAFLQGGAGRNDMVGALGSDGMAISTDKDIDGQATIVTVSALGGAMGLPEASSVVAHATRDTMRGADRLIEAIALCADECDKWSEHSRDLQSYIDAGQIGPPPPSPSRNIELLGMTPASFVLKTLRSVRPSDVDQVLLTLPFSDALRLLRFLLHMLRKGQGVELCTRAALLLLRVHHSQLAASASRLPGGSAGVGVSASATSSSASGSGESLLPLIVSLKAAMTGAVQDGKDQVGFNVAGLKFIDKSLSSIVEASAFIGGGVVSDIRGEKKKEKKGGKKKNTETGGGGEEEGIRIGKRRKVQLL
jgi:U3 small nucleolar RNA-associated protein 12